jgi:hypothetical protein
MFTYRVLKNLPPVPQHFIDSAVELKKFIDTDNVEDNLSDSYKSRKLIIDGETQPVTYQTRLDVNQEFYKWVHENIHPDGFDCGVSFTSSTQGKFQGPHTDLTRDFTMLYLLEPGGPDTETVFYHEHGEPVRREKRQTVCNDFSKLTVLERVKFPLHQWVILDAMVLHGVENITDCRVSFQVSVNENIFF